MQVFSETNLKSFERESDVRFCARLEGFLKNKIEDLKEVPSERFLPQLEVLLARSRSYGLDTEQQIATFALTAGFLGFDFDSEFPAVNAILGASDVNSEEKRIWLENFTTTIFETLAD